MSSDGPVKRFLRRTFQKLSQIIFIILSFSIRIFLNVTKGKGKKVPPISNPILMHSAVELASKIRNQEVCTRTFTNITIIELCPNFIDY